MFVGLASNDWVELMGKIQVLLTDDHETILARARVELGEDFDMTSLVR
jgi:hypothetical protein